MSKPVVKTLQADMNLAPPQKSQHSSYLTESPVQSPALPRKEVVQQSQQQSSAASRKPLSVADVTALPESWTLENAIKLVSLYFAFQEISYWYFRTLLLFYDQWQSRFDNV